MANDNVFIFTRIIKQTTNDSRPCPLVIQQCNSLCSVTDRQRHQRILTAKCLMSEVTIKFTQWLTNRSGQFKYILSTPYREGKDTAR